MSTPHFLCDPQWADNLPITRMDDSAYFPCAAAVAPRVDHEQVGGSPRVAGCLARELGVSGAVITSGYNSSVIFHIAPLGAWLADPDRPYTPPSTPRDGTVHCLCAPEAVLAAAGRFHRETPGPLVALVIDESLLGAAVDRVPPASGSPLAGQPGARLTRIHGPVDHDAVTALLEIVRDEHGRASHLTPMPDRDGCPSTEGAPR
ncbi:hypothetical protein GCM10014713_44640 [Streptomyces purpureus]|uniref:Uncharacterized protein n=1 Tax=Streptomyces purpureus TaxID=1951 RepID=A0A918LT22_9ACTN|nr:hypothetical protein GCM10014713_44640 [Streptomyces purpureus]